MNSSEALGAVGSPESPSSTASGEGPVAGLPPSKQHALELDSLRALAIFSVLLHHYLPDSDLNRLQNHLQQGPVFGVPLFFALSGFLITRILVQSRGAVDAGLTSTGHSLYIFYARRCLRIFPIYYATLFVGLVLKFTNIHKALPWHLLYLSNVYYFRRGAFDHGPAPVFWTLSVEEQFYLIWPFIILLMPIRKLPVITLATAVISAILAGWASDRYYMINLLLPCQLSCLALGSYLGLSGTAPVGSAAIQHRAANYFLLAVPIFGILSVAAYFFIPHGRLELEVTNGFRYFAAALLFAWVVARLSRGLGGVIGQILRWGPFTYIGRISYGMYILQFFVTGLLSRAMPKVSAHLGAVHAGWLLESFPARVIAIIAAASVSWFLLEKPMNDLKRFFPYPRTRLSRLPTLVRPD